MNNSVATTHAYWSWTIKDMDGGWWEPGLPLLEWETTDKHEDHARMIHVALG